MIISFRDVSAGIVNDTPDHQLPLNTWSAGRNIRFSDNGLEKFKGDSAVYDPPTIAPYWTLPVPQASVYYWMYCGLNKIYVTDGTTHYNLTRQTAAVDVDYAATATQNWNGGLIQGIPVLNNGLDDPQMWDSLATGTRVNSLTWDASFTWSDKSYTVNVIRPFDHVLVGLNFYNGTTRYPRRVMWSHPADPGAVPPTWDETDTTKDAGYVDLDETSGNCIDCLTLGNTNIIYKEDSYYGMQYIGGNSIYRFWKIDDVGILSRRCVKQFDEGHVFLTPGPDLRIHQGGKSKSIISKKWRKWLSDNLDSTNYERAYITPNYTKKEMWVCIPVTGDSFPTKALVWNWEDNTFGLRDLTDAAHIAFGVVDPSEDITWDSDSGTWDSDTSTWDERLYNPSRQNLLIADPTNTKLYLADDTNTLNGTNMTTYIERTGLHTFDTGGGEDVIKKVRKIRPRMTSTGEITVRVGSQMSKNDGISWTSYTFDPNTQDEIDVRVSGKFIGVRFESSTDIHWTLEGYDMDLVFGGTR